VHRTALKIPYSPKRCKSKSAHANPCIIRSNRICKLLLCRFGEYGILGAPAISVKDVIVNGEVFVKLPVSVVVVLHGQVGNIRSRMNLVQELIAKGQSNRALEICAEVQTETDYLESYLPPMPGKLPI